MAVSGTSRKLNNNDAKTLPFYFDSLQTVEKVCEFMSTYLHTDGYFLLRQSRSRPGYFTISVTHGRGIKHIGVENEGGLYHFSVEKFDTLQKLVDFYTKNPVPNIEGFTEVYLRMPIVNSERTRSVSNNPAACAGNAPRPPMPLPSVAPEPRVYSEAIDENYDRSRQLVAQLKAAEVELCECGLTLEESELPDGWTVHLSREHGKVFYTAPDGHTTAWNLPNDIIVLLTSRQQANIRRFIAMVQKQ